MHAVVSAIAQDGLYVVALLALVVWFTVPRSDKVALAVEMVAGLVAVAVLVKVAGAVHTDPRPFVQDPSIRPWFSHPPDNGFPSDHTAVAAVTSLVVLRRRPPAGVVLLLMAASIGVARVVAHVHHVQDVVAGLAIGLVAAFAAALLWRAVRHLEPVRRAAGRGTSGQETASPRPGGAP